MGDTGTGAQGPQGKIGDTGVQGSQGKVGDTGATGATGPGLSNNVVITGDAVVCGVAPTAPNSTEGCATGNQTTATATCAPNFVVLAGGWQLTYSDPNDRASGKAYIESSFPATTTRWQVNAVITSNLGGDTITVQVFAVCGAE